MISTTFDEIITHVLADEGGYVNDPADTGGETKYGISKKQYPNLDIKNLSLDAAKEIYKRDYWDKYQCEKIPDSLKYVYFDMCVNMGGKRAVLILQQAAYCKGYHDLKVDGILGPITLKSINDLTIESIQAYRVLFYAQLAVRMPEQSKFLYGWCKRAVSCP